MGTKENESHKEVTGKSDEDTAQETPVAEEVETVEVVEEITEEAEATEEVAETKAVEDATPQEEGIVAEDAETAVAEPLEPEVPAAENEVPAAEKSGLLMRWYVVHTYSGHENKVKENIQKMINLSKIGDHFSKIIVPTEEVAEMKKGKKTVSTRKFFPSYILIEMHMTDESRHLVSDMPGVTSFVGTASGPQPLSDSEVERILGRMDKEKQTIIPEIPFTLGEHIRIKDGPFSDFTGIVDEINADRGKLKVLVSIFGRETPVELDFLQVENL